MALQPIKFELVAHAATESSLTSEIYDLASLSIQYIIKATKTRADQTLQAILAAN